MILPFVVALAASTAQATMPPQPVQPPGAQAPSTAPPAEAQPVQPAPVPQAQPAPRPPQPVQPPTGSSRQPYYVLARDLQRRCNQGPAGIDYCYAYVTSVYDTVRSYELWLGMKEMCVPTGTMQSDLVRTVLNYIRVHPEVLDSLAASATVVALQQRYRCPEAAAQQPATR